MHHMCSIYKCALLQPHIECPLHAVHREMMVCTAYRVSSIRGAQCGYDCAPRIECPLYAVHSVGANVHRI